MVRQAAMGVEVSQVEKVQAPGTAISSTQNTGLHHLSPLLHSCPASLTHYNSSFWADDMKSILG